MQAMKRFRTAASRITMRPMQKIVNASCTKLTPGLIVLASLVILPNQMIDRASAEVTFLNTWGSNGSGNGQFSFSTGVAVATTGQVYVADTSNHRIQRFFDSDAWVSGTNAFTDGSVGPTSVAVGPGEILGASLILDATKGLVVGDTTTVNPGGSLTVTDGTLTTDTLLLAGGTLSITDVSRINNLQFSSGR